jgi:hypothetical protein
VICPLTSPVGRPPTPLASLEPRQSWDSSNSWHLGPPTYFLVLPPAQGTPKPSRCSGTAHAVQLVDLFLQPVDANAAD